MTITAAVAKYLSENVDGLRYDEENAGGNLFISNLPDDPDDAIAIRSTGGLTWDSDGDATHPYDKPTIQVIARSPYGDLDAGLRNLNAIYNALQGLHAETLDEGGTDAVYVINCVALQSDPADIGRDDNERQRYSQNYALTIHNPTMHRS